MSPKAEGISSIKDMYTITPADRPNEKARNFFLLPSPRLPEAIGIIEISQPIRVDRPAIIVIKSAMTKWLIR